MAEKKGPKKTKRGTLAAKIGGVVLAVLVLSFVSAFIAYAKEYENEVIPNLFFMGNSFSGKTKEDLRSSLKQMSDEYAKRSIKIVNGDKTFEIKFSDLDWKLDVDEMTDEIYSFGHSGNAVKDLYSLARVGVKRVDIATNFSFNENQAVDWLYTVDSQLGKAKEEANVQVKNGKAKIISPSDGSGINQNVVKEDIYKHLSLAEEGDIKAELTTSKPNITKEEAEKLADKALSLVSKPLEIVGPKSTIEWSSNVLGGLIEIKKKEEKKGFLQSPTYSDAYVSFSGSKISSLLEEYSGELNKDPIEARFTVQDGQVTIQTPSKDGVIVDIDSAKNKIVEVLEVGSEKSITLPVKAREASIKASSSSDIVKYGVKELIGSASTTFNGSSANRVHNVKTGVQAISGALIKPGEEFSTTTRLGVIDASTGYLEEMVIKEDKTVPEFGGGLCQVSTTLFRAAMQSGLKITERRSHAYRVSYYEPPVGMDATIYSPSPDLKFLNDTSSYILVQGRVEGYTATFDFYGTKDGREVEISESNVYDITEPPAPIYIDDPSLAPGEEKRIDRAHAGAKASFTYKVRKNGELIIDQKFNSSYVAWPAKYLKGPAVTEGGDEQKTE